MRSSLGTNYSNDNSKINFDLKITCCYRKKSEKKIKNKKLPGKIFSGITRSGVTKPDESIKNFEIYGTPVCFEQNRNCSPYKTKIYSNFHSFCLKKEATKKLDKTRKTKQNTARGNPHRIYDQERHYSSREKPLRKLVNRKPLNSIVTPRIPLEIKTSLFPQSQTNFHNIKEPLLFSTTEEARRAIIHILSCQDEQFLNTRVRPFVSGNLLNRYIQDVYDYLYQRHVETLNNVCTTELPPHRRSIHIHNKDCLYEEGSEQKTVSVNTERNQTSDEDSEDEDLAEGLEHVSIDQPLVRVSPISVN